MDGLRGYVTVGCLCLDGIVPGLQDRTVPSWAFDLPGVEARRFCCPDARRLWDQLQADLQALREEWGECAVMAAGTGCVAALALAEQLPVLRTVLVDPAVPGRRPRECAPFPGESPDAVRMARRLAGFARRNLTLCVGDMLIVEHDRAERRRPGLRGFGKPVNCRVRRLLLGGESAKELYTIREFAVKEAISCFLHTGDVPKPLAQNPEMCIIYG